MGTGNRTRLIAAVIAVWLPGECCFGFEDGDFQFWQTAVASLDLNQDWTMAVEEQLRFGNDAGHLYYHHTDLGFVYGGLADWIDLGFNFKEIFLEDIHGRWSRENRPHLNITFKGRLGTLDWTDGSRFEYRDRETEEDLWRYVNRLKVKLPWEFTRFKFRPYVADFVFINFEGRAFEQNRIFSGVSFELTRDMESELYYFWQSARFDDQWQDMSALGLQLKIYF